MPYSITKRENQWCVIKDADGESMGCHDSEDAAKAQMAAIHANEHKELSARVVKKTELYEQINALYKAIDVLDGDAPLGETVAPEVSGTISHTWDIAGLDLPPVKDAVLDAFNDGHVLVELESGEVKSIDLHTHAEPDHKTLYAAPDSNDTNILKALMGKLRGGMKPGQSVLKAADGKRLMLIVTSNSYQDREDETLTSTALKEDVDRHWTQGDDTFMSNNKLLFWHEDALELGDIIWGDLIGPFYVEVAKEADSPIAKRYFDYREAHPDEKWGASHRFAYYTSHRSEGGDYARIYKQETTSLPLEAAANLITINEVIPMSDKRAKKFNDIMGLDGAYELLKTQGFDALTKKLAEQGIEHKTLGNPLVEASINPDAVLQMAKAYVQIIEDAEEQDKAIAEALVKLDAATKATDAAKSAFDTKSAALDTALKSVQEKQEALDTQLKQRPTSASRAAETVIESDQISKEVQESLLPKHPTFGVPYKSGDNNR